MCSYCGCESETVISELMGEHATISALAREVQAALHQGDRGRAERACAEIASLFSVHGQKEERGLFTELALDSLATATVAELAADHRRLDAALAAAPGMDEKAIASVLDDLLGHANREDTDVFPTALQILPDDAWERVKKVHGAMSGHGTQAPRAQ